jgi:hypothetical protein
MKLVEGGIDFSVSEKTRAYIALIAGLAIACAIIWLCAGCAVGRVNITNSNGSKWSATVVTLLQKIDLPYGNIEGVATVKDYKQSADEAAISAIVEGAVRGAMKGAL